jgi:hypothetical protein
LSSKARRYVTQTIHPDCGDGPESGQAVIGLLLLFALLVFAGLGLAVDMSNVWSHRQAAQSAADAACQAGAMDMLATTAGLQLNSMGFTPGTASNCAASSGATMCTYAGFNGYSGAGPQPASNSNSAWNTVSWSFPASVAGIAPPPASVTTTPYVQVSIIESVKTYFIGLFTSSSYVQVNTTSTCGLAEVKEAAPIVVLHPSMSGSLYYSGGASLNIVGGPQRSIQVNSTSATAVLCLPSGVINTSKGGPSLTGSDLGVVGAESQDQAGCENSGGYEGFYGGTTGNWRSSVLPVPDPYASLSPPASVKSSAQRPITYVSSTQYYTWVGYHTDGCPDQTTTYVQGMSTATCAEFGPGYYPNGIVLPNDYSTIIFLPGVYYVNGSFSPGGSNTIRNALPCWTTYTSGYSASACSPVASANGLAYSPTQGVMFYFTNSGTFTVSGGQSNHALDNVPASALTCDGSQPSSTLDMPSAGLAGNVLWAQCTQNATYWDNGGDTTDPPGDPGNRGILFFQDHADTSSPTLSGSGELAYGGSLYFHSTSYADVLALSGGSGSGSYILGNIVTDQIKLTGSGSIGMQLNSLPTTYMPKVAVFQ